MLYVDIIILNVYTLCKYKKYFAKKRYFVVLPILQIVREIYQGTELVLYGGVQLDTVKVIRTVHCGTIGYSVWQ